MPATSVDANRQYSDDRFTAVEAFNTDRMKVICGYFEPGQFIPVHAPGSDVTICILRGNGTIREGDTDYQVGPGDVVAVEAGTDRGVKAADDGRLEAVLVTAPPPTDAEHDPVRQELEEGVFDPS
jgi:quercetin dioxygenase-like cupin family protein